MAKHQPGTRSAQEYMFFNEKTPNQETFGEDDILSIKNKVEKIYDEYGCNLRWWSTLQKLEKSLMMASKYRVTSFSELEPMHYRWWLDHYIMELGFQVWNDVSKKVYDEKNDTRISDKIADEARSKFFANFK
jgi:hypothetical protein